MTWTVVFGRGGPLIEASRPNAHSTGWFSARSSTEEDAVAHARELIAKGYGVHSVSEEGSGEPKYRSSDLIALISAQS